MSDIRFNQWLHNSGTGGVSQVDGGHVGIGTTNPLIPVGAGVTAVLNVGVVTANSFYGSGANLTSLPAQATIANNADNRVITGGSGVNLNGEANLTYNGSILHNQISAGARNDFSTAADGLIIEKGGNTGLSIDPGSSGVANIYFPNESNHSIASISHNNSNGELRVRGEDHIILSTNSNTERLRITSAGYVGVGENSPATILHVKANVGDMLRLDRNNTGSVGNQISFRHSASGTLTETGSINCVSAANAAAGELRFYTKTSGGSNTEKVRITSDGRTFINTTAVTNTNDALTVKRAAGSFTEMSMTVDANTATGTHANAFVFTKSKNTYWNGLGFQSSHGHIGAIVGMRDSTGMNASQKIRIELGGTGINASEEKTWDFLNDGNLSISDGNLVVASGHGIDFSATASNGTSELLDDYEEGSWTPTSRNAGSFSNHTGRYVKVGHQVTVWGLIGDCNNNTSTAGFEISGLPYTATSSSHQEFVGPCMIRFVSATGQNGATFTTYQAGGWNYLRIYASIDDGNNYAKVTHNDFSFTGSQGVRFCHSYTV